MEDIITFCILLGYIAFTIKAIQEEGIIFVILTQSVIFSFVYALLA